MEPALCYATAVGGFFLLLCLSNAIHRLIRLFKPWIFLQRHLVHTLVLRRHRLVGPWTFADVLVQLIYLMVNIFCCSFKTPTANEASIRVGQMSLINLAPVYFGLHFSFVCDILGVPLFTQRRIHRSAAIMSLLLALIHIVINVVEKTRLVQDDLWKWYGLTAIVLMALTLFLPFCVSFIPIYEIILRFHQGLAIAAIYALWKHIPVNSRLPHVYLFTASCTFATTFFSECLLILYRNVTPHQRWCRALLARQNGSLRMTIFVARPWFVKAGHYVTISIPSVSPLSILQGHNFMVASSSDDKGCIDLIIEPRDGFTRKLFDIAKDYQKDEKESKEGDHPFGFARDHPGKPKLSDFRTVILSGPHGMTYSLGNYSKVLMFAEGFGITAVLQFLREVRTRHIYVHWQLKHLGDQHPVTVLLDRALKEHTLDKGYVLRISVYFEHGNLDPSPQLVGEHGRSTYYNGKIDLCEQLRHHLDSQSQGSNERVFITVSAGDQLRDGLRNEIRSRMHEGVNFVELEYQPVQKRRRPWLFR